MCSEEQSETAKANRELRRTLQLMEKRLELEKEGLGKEDLEL